jgi:hypothetical protein
MAAGLPLLFGMIWPEGTYEAVNESGEDGAE